MSININVTNQIVQIDETSEVVQINASGGIGVPSGGLTNQILAKNSNTNYDFKWTDNVASVYWGQVSGTLSNQTDLQNALNLKVPYTGATGNVTLGTFGLTAGTLTLQPQALNTSTFSIGQTMATNDSWKIYGFGSVADEGDLFFELQDNAAFINGQRFRFYYGNASSGTPKDILLMDYNGAVFDGTLKVTGLAGVGSRMVVTDANGALSTSALPQAALTLTTTGTSGAATLVGATLNIPQYAAGITGSGVANQLTYWNGTGSVTGSAGLTYVDSTGVITLSKNQNAATYLNISNTTSGTAAIALLSFTTSAGINTAQVFKASGTYTTYKIIKANDFGFYNGGANLGDISFLNDNSFGKIIFGAGSASTAQMTLTAAGRLLLGTTDESTFKLDAVGTARVSGQITAPSLISSSTLVLGESGVGRYTITGNEIFRNSGGGWLIAQFLGGTALGTYGLFVTTDLTQLGSASNLILSVHGSNQNVSIDSPGFAVATNTSSLLQVNSTTRGFLPPRMTTTQKNAIVSPATGLQVYDTTLGSLNVYNGTSWIALGAGGGGMAIGGSITSATAGSVLFAGTSGVLQQDNANFFWDDTNNRLGIGTASPSGILHLRSSQPQLIVETSEASSFAEVNVSVNPTSGANGYFRQYGNGASGTAFGLSVSNGTLLFSNDSAYLLIGTLKAQNLVFGTNNAERARITAAGRLLLGTTSESTYLLDVNGTARVSGETLFDSNLKFSTNEIYLYNPSSTRKNVVITPNFGLQTFTGNSNVYIGAVGSILTASNYVVAIGGLGNTPSAGSVVIGGTSTISASGSILISAGSNGNAASGSIVLQTNHSVSFYATQVRTLASGQFATNCREWYVGSVNGFTGVDSNANNGSINGEGASGTDRTGGVLTIAGGKGTGTGTSGDVVISTATPTTTGTTLQTLTNRWWIKNTTGTLSNISSPNASAITQIDSTTQGFLPPRMTTTQINAIASPAEGLIAYNTTISHLCCYQSGQWVKLNHSPM